MLSVQTLIEPVTVTDKELLDLLVAFAFIDGHIDDRERILLEKIGAEYGISQTEIAEKVEQHRNIKNHEEFCYQALDRITLPQIRERLVGHLCAIAAADNVAHESEMRFLNVIRERWGINITVGRQLQWDTDQESVIHASYRERLIVYAGPGMGKTAVACARVSKLLDQHVSATNIWMLSFTRAAVKEIRDRINSFCGHEFSSTGVKVATLDSRAWEIRYGMSEEKVEHLFGDYEQNIEAVLDMIQSKQEEIREEFSSIEHVIIDEAQDIIGVRAELLIAVMELLNPDCGFTIFADPAQAIYGFTGEDDDGDDEEDLNFLEMVRQKFGNSIKEKELKKIHRTNNPKLVKLIEDMRLDIYVNDEIDKAQFNKRKQFIEAHADRKAEQFHSSELHDNTLVLFRRRAEVLQASYHACNDGIPHRIRMSGYNSGLFSWIGYLFFDYPEYRIAKDKFFELCETKAKVGIIPVEDRFVYEQWWKLLHSTAGRENIVNLKQLRIKLSRNPGPIHLCYPDLGNTGAVLGTIHASKGREANNVILRLPALPAREDSDFDEESRVLFVGASRAKRELTVGTGLIDSSFSRSLENGRAYRKFKNNCAFVEIGLTNDLDEYSFVSRKRRKEHVDLNQHKLNEFSQHVPYKLNAVCVKEGDEYLYQIWTESDGKEVDRAVGEFSQSLNDDLWGIANDIGARKPPSKLNGLYMLGLRTVCKLEGDPNLENVHEPYRSTGLWVVPVIIANSLSYFSPPRPTRR